MKCLIINYNRLTLLKSTVNWCASHGLEPVIIDNASNYPPLMAYYETCGHNVLRMSRNFGHRVAWDTGLISSLGLQRERYILTDPDLDYTGIPDDFLYVLNEGLDRHRGYAKCGFSLLLDDLPPTSEGNFIRKNEAGYWLAPVDDMYYAAGIDTTFALYREGNIKHTYSAIRTNKPYTARHLPWYYDDFSVLPEDEQNYYKTANSSCSHLKRIQI